VERNSLREDERKTRDPNEDREDRNPEKNIEEKEPGTPARRRVVMHRKPMIAGVADFKETGFAFPVS
jgi:hypothetical protein